MGLQRFLADLAESTPAPPGVRNDVSTMVSIDRMSGSLMHVQVGDGTSHPMSRRDSDIDWNQYGRKAEVVCKGFGKGFE